MNVVWVTFYLNTIFSWGNLYDSIPKKTQTYDIDAPNDHNELIVVEYVKDIYRFAYVYVKINLP